MDTVKNDLYRLADKELQSANEKFPLFASSHEAYAVIFEEFDEAREELESLEYSLDQFWSEVRENSTEETKRKRLENIFEKSINLATEAIQIAAMARKGIVSGRREGDLTNGEAKEN